MVFENQQGIYCEDDGENRVYCIIGDEFCKERYYKNLLKSQTHTDNNLEKDFK